MELSDFHLPADGYEWQPVKTWQLAGWLIAYALIMMTYLPGGVRILDAAHMVTHEAGHPLFSYTHSEFLTVIGGTFLQLFVPAALAVSFAWRGHTLGTAFCGWAFFNSLVGVSIYMGDARDRAIPLVSLGVASDEVEGHDWAYIFDWIGHGAIMHDRQLASITLFIAWAGMLAAVGWLIWMWRTNPVE